MVMVRHFIEIIFDISIITNLPDVKDVDLFLKDCEILTIRGELDRHLFAPFKVNLLACLDKGSILLLHEL